MFGAMTILGKKACYQEVCHCKFLLVTVTDLPLPYMIRAVKQIDTCVQRTRASLTDKAVSEALCLSLLDRRLKTGGWPLPAQSSLTLFHQLLRDSFP